MKSKIIKKIQYIRSCIVTFVRPKDSYFLFPTRTTKPISAKFGFDRGTPVDRFYIEKFLEAHKHLLTGVCLEIHDATYLNRFGNETITRKDVLDIDPTNKEANILGDLRSIPSIQDNSYDTIVLTHTLGVIDDHEAAVREVIRILKPGGTALVTVSSMGVAAIPRLAFWRYTPASLHYLFYKYVTNVQVLSYGNVLSGQAFWVGLSAEELTLEELSVNDPRYPVITTAVVVKNM